MSKQDARLQSRSQILSGLGLRYNGSEFCLNDFNVHWTEITCDSDEEFAAKVKKIKAEMKRREECDNKPL